MSKAVPDEKETSNVDIETSTKCEQNDTKGEKKKEWWTATHTITLLGFGIFTTEYTMRSNLSVTVVIMKDEFDWNEITQSQVLAAFFYGYLLTSFFGGRAAEYFGGKIVLTVSLLITSLLTVLSPVAVKGSTELFIAIRVAEGMAEGLCFPAMLYFMIKWVPKAERPRVATRIFTGSLFGTFITLPIGGWLSTSVLGWESVFYLTGVSGVVVGIFWIWIVTDDPRDSGRISACELEHILKDTFSVKTDNEVIPIPWKSILTCLNFWVIVGAHAGASFGFFTFLAELPTYLVEILGYSLSSAGTIAGATYFSSWVFGLFYSALITKLIIRGTITTSFSRKLSQGLTNYCSAIGFFILLFTDQTPSLAVAVFIFNGAIFSCSYSGFMISYADIAPRFAGTLLGIGNTFAAATGFIGPSITGVLTHNNQTVWAWRYVFIMTIFMFGVLATPYVLFYKNEVQEWNDPKQPEQVTPNDVVKPSVESLENARSDTEATKF